MNPSFGFASSSETATSGSCEGKQEAGASLQPVAHRIDITEQEQPAVSIRGRGINAKSLPTEHFSPGVSTVWLPSGPGLCSPVLSLWVHISKRTNWRTLWPSRVAQRLIDVREQLGSNLNWWTSCPHRSFMFSSVPVGRYLGCSLWLDCVTNVSLQILSKSFTNQSYSLTL